MKKKMTIIIVLVALAVTACCVFGIVAYSNLHQSKATGAINEVIEDAGISVSEEAKSSEELSRKAMELNDKEAKYTIEVVPGNRRESADERAVTIKLGTDNGIHTGDSKGTADGQSIPTASAGGTVSTEMGGYGRFEIPEYGFSLPLSYGMSQGIVDAWNLGAIFEAGESLVIADHDHQGFSIIKSCYPGMTANLVTYSGTVSLVCTGVDYGAYHDGALHESNGAVVGYDSHAGELMCYTCNDSSGYSITMVFWAPVTGSFGVSGGSNPADNSWLSVNNDPSNYSYSGPVMSTISAYYFSYLGTYQQSRDSIITYNDYDYYTLSACMFEAPAGKRFSYWGYDRNGTYAGMPGDSLYVAKNTSLKLYAIWEDIPDSRPSGGGSSNTPTPPATEPATKPATQPSTAPTEPPTEAPTEAPTQPSTEAPTEPPTEPPTEIPTEAPADSPVEPEAGAGD